MKNCLVAAAILCLAFFVYAHADPAPNSTSKFDSSGAEFIVPKIVNLSLFRWAENGRRIPVLFLSAMAGDSCDSASELKIKQSLNANTLTVDIEGYYLKKGEGGDCADAVLESRARVDIHDDWLKKKGDKEIIFRLGRQENKYKLFYDPNPMKAILTGLQIPNVLNCRPGYSAPSTGTPTEITLYPLDVQVLHVKGMSFANRITPITGDHRPALKAFAQKKGFVPADQIYPGILQDETNCLKVVRKDRSIPQGPGGESLGEFPNEVGAQIVLEKIMSFEEGSHCR